MQKFFYHSECHKLTSSIYLFIYEFLSRIASSVLKVNCYQFGSCVRGPSAFNSPFGHRSRSHNICPLDNHLSGLSISLSSLVLSWVYRLPFFKSLYDSAVTRTHNLPFWWWTLYLYTTSRFSPRLRNKVSIDIFYSLMKGFIFLND